MSLAVGLSFLAIGQVSLAAQRPKSLPVTPDCDACAEWNTPRRPVRIHGTTYYVGTDGLSALLVTSPEGHVLIDGGLAESAPLIAASIRSLGFRIEDIKVILNSHVHYDHAGGISLLQRASGARVIASKPAAAVLRTGRAGRDDPQYGLALPLDPVARVGVLPDSGVVRVGPLALTLHLTAGHTPGGTSWSWTSCDSTGCAEIVYADSQTPISADGFLYSRSSSYPTAVADFEAGHARLEAIRCDLLITPHPGGSSLWQRLGPDATAPLLDPAGCRRYAANARVRLAERLEREKGK